MRNEDALPPRELPPKDALLRLDDVLKLIPVKKTKWYAGVKAGLYPKPFALSPGDRARFYRASAIYALIEDAASADMPE
jgi:prophage regulatory protein